VNPPTEPARAALEYARGVHAEAHDFNRDLYRRAQIILTLDGIVIAVTGAALAAQPDDLRKTVAIFGSTTWVAVGVAGAALLAAVLSSAMALYSRHRQGARGDGDEDAYAPANMWFYGRIAELDRRRFIYVAEQADEVFETKARLAQVAIMAPIIVRRARWLNRAFVCTALALGAFALGAVDYVIRLAG
jgi:hypothetical protein